MTPLVMLALSFALGIAVEESLAPPVFAVALATAATLGGLALAWRRGRAWGVLALLHALSLGALCASLARPRAPDGLLDGKPWRVRAHVAEEPERALGEVHVLLALDEVTRAGQARAATGRVWLRVGGEPLEPLLPGDSVLFVATLREPRGFAEPAAPDPTRHLAERGVIATAGVPSPAALVRMSDGTAHTGVARPVAAWRARLLALVADTLSGERRALVESLVLGERGDVPADLDQAFRTAGVSHVLSVSGLHLAIAAFLFYVGLRRLLVRIGPLARRSSVRRWAAMAALPAVILYTLLTGAAVATVRSCVVAVVFLVGAAVERPPSTPTALAAAALVLLGASPLTLYDPSFQLSFAAALGCVLIAPRIARPVAERLAGPSWGRRLARAIVGIVAASIAALLATAPLAAWHFAQLAPVGLVANVVVVPLAELWVLPLGLVGCLVGGAGKLLRIPGQWLLRLAGVGAAAMAWAVRAFASLPGAESLSHVRAPTLLESAAWYGALLALVIGSGAGSDGQSASPDVRRAARRAALACALVLASSLGLHALWPRLAPSLRIDFLDVGQGDSALVRLPDGTTLLVDGGGSFDPRFDPGQALLVPWLERQGVRRIDVLVLTHPHPDHANGLCSVLTRFAVGQVWTNGARSSLPALGCIEAEAARKHVPVVRPHDLVRGPATVEVLSPPAVPPGWSENDGSIVLRVAFTGRAALLLGDVEARAEAHLAATAGERLRADVIKAPHHGSRTSSSSALVEAAHASLVVFSVGNANRWGFPAPSVVERWRAAGARTLRTDRDGGVSVTIDRSGAIDVRTARPPTRAGAQW